MAPQARDSYSAMAASDSTGLVRAAGKARLALPLVVTDDFASHLPGRFRSLGLHRVRGVDGDIEVFGRS